MKTSNKLLLSLFGILVFLFLSSLIYLRFNGIGFGEKIIASGNVKSEKRQSSGFNSVLLNGSFTTTISQGETYLVDIEADENILQHLTTEVMDDSSLSIGFKKGVVIQSGSPVIIHLQAPHWTNIGLQGSGNLTSSGQLRGNKLEVQSNGSGEMKLDLDYNTVNLELNGSPNIEVSGSSSSLYAEANGSGNIKANELICQKVGLYISGSGDAIVHADSILNVQVNGSGNVTYSGNAGIVNSKMYGSGELKKR